jgi:hypothetical protein
VETQCTACGAKGSQTISATLFSDPSRRTIPAKVRQAMLMATLDAIRHAKVG